MHTFYCYNHMYVNLIWVFFSTFISHIWDYILERNNRPCVNMGYPWSSFSVHMILLTNKVYTNGEEETVYPNFKFHDPWGRCFYASLGCNHIVLIVNMYSGRSRNFRTGGAVQSQYKFWGLEIVLMPFTPTLCFCSESGEYNTYCKHCMLITIKFMRVLQSKFSKINP